MTRATELDGELVDAGLDMIVSMLRQKYLPVARILKWLGHIIIMYIPKIQLGILFSHTFGGVPSKVSSQEVKSQSDF